MKFAVPNYTTLKYLYYFEYLGSQVGTRYRYGTVPVATLPWVYKYEMRRVIKGLSSEMEGIPMLLPILIIQHLFSIANDAAPINFFY